MHKNALTICKKLKKKNCWTWKLIRWKRGGEWWTKEEWIIYPCQPSNESNSLSLKLSDSPPCLPKEDECYVPVDSLEIFPMSKTCENNYAPVIYDNPCYFDKSYDNPLFVPNFEMHGTKEFCWENVYDKALDDGPMLLDNIYYTTNENGIGEVLTLSRSSISFWEWSIILL